MKSFFKKLADFFRYGVWQKENDEFGSRKSFWLTRILRVLIYTLKGVGRHNTFIRASALTFYTLLSIVPILAVAFSIIKGLGLDARLELLVVDRFPALDQLMNLATGVIDRTKGGVVAIMGVVVLIWAAIKVFSNTEDAFNNIWEIRKKRSIGRKISAYAAMIFIVPLLWIVISALVAYSQNIISQFKDLPGSIFYSLGAVAVVWLLFAGMYKIIPNTKVRFRNAAIGAAFAAVGFMVFQVIYVAMRTGVNAYNVIYGGFAAIPLFLVWLQTSWILILMGAELSFSSQNMESYRDELDTLKVSYDNKRKVTVAVMLVIARHFAENSGLPPTSDDIAKHLKLPLRIVHEALNDLDLADLVVMVQDNDSDKVRRFVPAHEVGRMTLLDVMDKIEGLGKNIIKTPPEIPEIEVVDHLFEEMKEKALHSRANMPILTMLKNESSNIG